MNDIPMEVPAYLYRLIPSITGADSLMTMATYSYLAAISTDENRFFRFGLFSIVTTLVPLAGSSLSPTLFKYFSYAGNNCISFCNKIAFKLHSIYF